MRVLGFRFKSGISKAPRGCGPELSPRKEQKKRGSAATLKLSKFRPRRPKDPHFCLLFSNV